MASVNDLRFTMRITHAPFIRTGCCAIVLVALGACSDTSSPEGPVHQNAIVVIAQGPFTSGASVYWGKDAPTLHSFGIQAPDYPPAKVQWKFMGTSEWGDVYAFTLTINGKEEGLGAFVYAGYEVDILSHDTVRIWARPWNEGDQLEY
jgi:hypothetical protein